MRDKSIVISSLLVAALMLSMTVAPSLAFIYPDGSQDNYFENYGPRMDKILVKKYATLQSEINALKAGEIDFTDWALEKAMIDDLAGDTNIAVVGYGGEVGYYTFNYNNNPNQYLGNPPNSLYLNPKYNNNPTEVREFRQACSYLIDRQALVTGPGQGMYEDIYTPIPAYMTYWVHPDISYTGLLSALAYPPSVTDAAAALDAGGFHLGGAGGKRYMDKDGDNIYDAGEDFVIDLYSRADALRNGAAQMLEAGFNNPLINIAFTDTPGGGGVAWQKCMVEKDYHMYTAGWIYIGPDPDYMFDLYHWDNYYHPEDPPNWGAISQYNLALQNALRDVKYAPDAVTAQTAALLAQEEFAADACETPLASTSSPKAHNKWYTGGNDGVAKGDAEDKYRGQSWMQIVNMMGQGHNNGWTFLNAYPGTYEYGDGNMLVRYGWKDNTMPKTLNPMYSSWYWESEIWGKCFDGLGSRDPYTLGPVEVPGIAENWTLGSWSGGAKVTLTIRSDYMWADGIPVTMDDIIYTFVGMPAELFAKGCPDVWWQPTLDRIVGFFRLDAYTVEILLDVNTYLGANWIAGNVVIPKHIWQPYIATHTTAEISGDMSNQPEMLIGSGPFVYVENTAETVLMTRNPIYTGIFDKPVQLFNQYGLSGTQIKEGITVAAVSPTTQITPFKVKPAGTPPRASVHVKVPVTNLDVNDEQDFDKTIVVTGPSGTVHTVPLHNVILGPTAWHIEEFDLTNLPPGIYTITVTIEIKSGDVFDWVHANLDPALWGMILGPYITVKKFWVTVLADLNEDCVVDIFDIVIVGSRFGAAFGEPLYSPQADVNHDFIIDIFDIVQVALVFGWPG
jgi:hypothetical protein